MQMKMKHKETGEIVIVIGYIAPDKNCRKTHAICLCDARLHPGENGRKTPKDGTIEIEFPAKKLEPLELPNWDEVRQFYSDGEYEELLRSREDRFKKWLETAANSVEKQEMANLRKSGIADEAIITELAAKKKEAYIKSFLGPKNEDGGSEQRPVRW